jgi:plastocyanin
MIWLSRIFTKLGDTVRLSRKVGQPILAAAGWTELHVKGGAGSTAGCRQDRLPHNLSRLAKKRRFSSICRSLCVVLALPLAAATVSGTVELRDSREPAVRKGRDYSGVVVSLEPANGLLKTANQTHHAQMVQKNKTFTPHILAVIVGTTVDFPNYDPIFHNAFSTYDGQLFDVGLYPPGSTRGVRFSRAGVVRVFCNIHANMSAVIVALNTPYFDKTRADGHFEIPNVPPGDYILHVFHERATAATLATISRKIAVEDAPVTLPGIMISESGYLPIPHKNKYGRDYPPAHDDGGVYPAVRK